MKKEKKHNKSTQKNNSKLKKKFNSAQISVFKQANLGKDHNVIFKKKKNLKKQKQQSINLTISWVT